MPADIDDLLSTAEGHLDRGEYRQAEEVVQRLLSNVYDGKRQPPVKIRTHLCVARTLVQRGEFLDGVKHCMEALRIANEIGDVAAQAVSMRWLGRVHNRKGDFNMAYEYFNEAIGKVKELEDRWLEGSIHTDLGLVFKNLGDPKRSIEEYEAGIAILEAIPGAKDLHRAYNNLGDVYSEMENWQKAAEFFSKAKDAAGDNIAGRAWGSFNKAECLMELGRCDDAMKELDEAIPLIEKSGDILGRLAALDIRGLVRGRMGDWKGAISDLKISMDMARREDMPVAMAHIMKDLGRVLIWKGDKKEARKHLENAKDVLKEHGAKVDLEKTERLLSSLN